MAYIKLWENLLDSTKVQKLSPSLFKWWVNLLLSVSREGGAGGELPHKMSLVLSTRTDRKTTDRRIRKMTQLMFLDPITESPIGGMLFKVHDWSYWQASKDVTAADRQRRYRERHAQRHAQHNGVTDRDESVTPLRASPVMSRPQGIKDGMNTNCLPVPKPSGVAPRTHAHAREDVPPIEDEALARVLAEEQRHREAGARLLAKPEPDPSPRQS